MKPRSERHRSYAQTARPFLLTFTRLTVQNNNSNPKKIKAEISKTFLNFRLKRLKRFVDRQPRGKKRTLLFCNFSPASSGIVVFVLGIEFASDLHTTSCVLHENFW